MAVKNTNLNNDQAGCTPLISIVLPVYNPELADLARSIDSVLAQEGSYELVIIDDGSNQNTKEALDCFAQSNHRIRVFHQPNRGVSNARNHGIRQSKGSYITFIDADDQFMPNMLSSATSVIEQSKADIIFGGIKKEYVGGASRLSAQTFDGKATWKSFSGDDLLYFKAATFDSQAMVKLGLRPVMYFSCCGTLYRRELIEHIQFNEQIKYSEDSIFNWEAISQAANVAISAGYWYLYQENDSSATGKVQPNILSLMVPTLKECLRLRESADEEMRQYIDNGIYLFCFYRVFFCSIIQFSFIRYFKCTKTHFVKTVFHQPEYENALMLIRPNEPRPAFITSLARRRHFFLVAQIVSLGNRVARISQSFRMRLYKKRSI